MSHGSAGAIGSMDVADGDFLGADRCGASNPARPRSGTPRPAARPGMALAASFLEFPTHLGPRHWRHDAWQRARQARSERARARTRRPECSDLDVGRLPGARPGLQSVPWPGRSPTKPRICRWQRHGPGPRGRKPSPPEAFAAADRVRATPARGGGRGTIAQRGATKDVGVRRACAPGRGRGVPRLSRRRGRGGPRPSTRPGASFRRPHARLARTPGRWPA